MPVPCGSWKETNGYQLTFRYFEEWTAWLQTHPEILDHSHVRGIVARVQTEGVDCKFCNRHLVPQEVAINGENYRETMVCPCGLNTRQRAVLGELADFVRGRTPHRLRIYAPEAITPLALKLRGNYARFTGSEYTPDPARRDDLFPIPFQDLSALTFPDGRFDAVVVNDVFEHVPDLPTVLLEIARVLRPGGVLISTFPFAYTRKDTVVRARIEDGRVVHLSEPEYHGDPMNPEGALVFQIPGWDLLEEARQAGFADAKIRFLSSRRFGFTARKIAGLFVFCAFKG